MSTNTQIWEIKRHWLWSLLLVALLIAINFVCFGRTLGGYYLADDYIHVAYLSRVFSGHPELLWQNFYSNWLQTQGTQFYRPLISLTLAFDYLIWHANPIGYHLTNTLYQCVSSIFLFLLTRRMLREFGERQAMTAAFFAAYPLHAEVVSWIIGRVDGVCTAFYLAAFWSFVVWYQDKRKSHLIFSCAAFMLALLSKEMAITLPPTLVVYVLFSKGLLAPNWPSRIKDAAKTTWMFWFLLAGYLIVRTFSLGTLSGGYTGSIGEGLSGSFYKRLFLDGSMMRVMLPFDASVFSPFHKLRKMLSTLYVIGGISVLVRLLVSFKENGLTRYVAFAFLWLVISMIPTYQVFNLTDNLQSSRFIYMGTAPLALLLVLMIFPLGNLVKAKLFRIVACLLLAGFLLCFIQITQGNNKPWVAAHREVRALRHELERVVTQLAPDKQVVLLNLPQRVGGAHELYNAAMLWILLQPPLTNPSISSRVVTFEPMTYGDSEIFIVSRLRQMLSKNPTGYEFYTWNRQRNTLVPVHIIATGKEVSFPAQDFAALSFSDDTFIVSPPLDLAPAAIDFVDVDVTARSSKQALVSLYWDSEGEKSFSDQRRLTMLVQADGKPHTYRFNVSEHKSWIMSGDISRLRLDLPEKATINSVRLVKGDKEIPQLVADDSTVTLAIEGVYRPTKTPLLFQYDAAQIPAAKEVAVEVTKPDSWFEHYTGQLRDKNLSDKCFKSWRLGKLTGTFELDPNSLPAAGYYQVRIAAINAQGNVAGYVSDPINLQLHPEKLSKSCDELVAAKRRR